MTTSVESRITIKDIETIGQLRDVERLQKEVWGIDDVDVVPLTQMVAAREAGGVLVGAFDGEKTVGFAYGFAGCEQGEVTLHSHMLAVNAEYRNHNLGYKLKLAQRERSLARGYRRMTWTFDPLQCLNAHFNFAKLGVVADSYKINFYGEDTSILLEGAGTDRLWVSWLLESSRVMERLERDTAPPLSTTDIGQARPLVRVAEDNSPSLDESAEALSADRAFIEIPGNIGEMGRQSRSLVVEWRVATRRAFTTAVTSGYLVEDFYRHSRQDCRLGTYVLTRGKSAADFA